MADLLMPPHYLGRTSPPLPDPPRLSTAPLPSEEGTSEKVYGLLPESQGRNMALTVLYSLDISWGLDCLIFWA